jgi:predicted TIM-barrel fold metal-dependent hydrolase
VASNPISLPRFLLVGVTFLVAGSPAAQVPFVDLHTHLEAGEPSTSVRAALQAMPRENAVRIVFQPPPFTADDPARYDAELLLPAIEGRADRLVVFGGGGTLNPMIHEAVRTGQAGPEVQRRFRERAEQLLRQGIAGFGELAAEHFPGATPYESAPADHPLFLLLADIAAEHGVPIVLHMEAIAHAMPVPAGIGPLPGKPELAPNIDGLERLLSHNPRARIVWAHAGWDRTGHRTPELCRRLLRSHPNLYMDVKLDPGSPGKNSPILPGPRPSVSPEWLQLFRDFPDRFVMGSDQHYPEPASGTQRWEAIAALLRQLPPDLQRAMGTENAARLLSRDPR